MLKGGIEAILGGSDLSLKDDIDDKETREVIKDSGDKLKQYYQLDHKVPTKAGCDLFLISSFFLD